MSSLILTIGKFSLRWIETNKPRMIPFKAKKQHSPPYSLPLTKVLHSKTP